jgi:hypothetical protein
MQCNVKCSDSNNLAKRGIDCNAIIELTKIFTMANVNLGQPSFDDRQFRLGQLELWRELAVRPTRQDSHPDDWILLDDAVDDLGALSEHCLVARALMNDLLPLPEQARDDELVARMSSIPGAGLGLYYDRCQSQDSTVIAKGETFCYMTGHLHNHRSAKTLANQNYLLLLLGDLLVDSGPLLHIKARYINDPLNEMFVNCKFVPEQSRAAVVATRDIQLGEELFVSYGPGYWLQHGTIGNPMV